MAIGFESNADSTKCPPQPTTPSEIEIDVETFVETYVRTHVASTPQPATVNRLTQLEDEGRRSLKLLYIMIIVFFSIVIICFFIPSRESSLDESIQFDQSNDFDQSNEYEPSIHWEPYNSKLASRPKAPYKSPSLHKISSTKTQVQYKATGGYQPRTSGAVQKSRKKG